MSDLDPIQTERNERASDGCRLHAYEWTSRANEQKDGALIALMHGYAEHAGRYRELAEYLVRAGHIVHAFDARGHGQSDGQRGHVESYERFVDDYYEFVHALKQRYPSRPLIYFGHSNGGLIALRTIQSRPRLADGFVTTSPMMGLAKAHQPVPVWLAALLPGVLARVPVPNGIHAEELTHDQRILEAHERDRLNHDWTTPSWYVAAHEAMNHAFANLATVRLPVLVFQATRDPIVVPQAIERMFHGLGSMDKELVVVHESFHEILNEVGRQSTYQRITSWLAARWKTSAAA